MTPEQAPPAAEPIGPTPEDEELARVLDDYLAQVEAGRPVDPESLLMEHPAIAGRLRACLSSLRVVEQALAVLPPSADSSGARLPQLSDFRILHEIGRGGMGMVYEAEQLSLNRRVALKVLPFAAALDARQLQRFRHEAQAAAHLHHTNIVPVYSVGCERGIHFYSMQYIEGQSLAQVIAEQREDRGSRIEDRGSRAADQAPTAAEGGPTAQTLPFDPRSSILDPRSSFLRTVAHLGVQAAEALEHAHQMGIVHRDIKPANLLVEWRAGDVSIPVLWITDFGLAHFQGNAGLTLTGDLVGTLRYMAPEQAMGKRGVVDHRADIYSLGVTLYELLTLTPAFDGRDRQELLRQIAFEDPRAPRRLNPAIPADLETIVLKATAKQPQDRYTSAQELADDLRRFLEHRPILARRPSLIERAAKWARRHRPVVGAAVVLLLLAVVGLALSTVLISQEQARTQAALDLLAEEQNRTRTAYQGVAQQRTRAEANFRQAQQALNFFTQLSEALLIDRPEVRRKFLEAALQYYKDFIEQQHDDPSIKAELEASHERVARILTEIGTPADVLAASRFLQDGNHLRLLSQESVQKELELSTEQLRKIADLLDRRSELYSDFRGWGPEEWHARSQRLAVHDRAALALLQPDQVKRLQQIVLQLRGTQAFLDAEVADVLGLTAPQREKIRTIHDEGRRTAPNDPRGMMWDGFGGPGFRFGGWRREPDREGAPKRPEEGGKSIKDQVMQVLTGDQKTKWQEMTGESFQGEVRFGPPSMGFPWSDFRRRGP